MSWLLCILHLNLHLYTWKTKKYIVYFHEIYNQIKIEILKCMTYHNYNHNLIILN